MKRAVVRAAVKVDLIFVKVIKRMMKRSLNKIRNRWVS